MKLATMYKLASIVAAVALPSLALAGGSEPEWWHSHGHGGGGVTMVGKPGHPGKVSRTVQVNMTDDLRFTPSAIAVKKGETIRFLVKNSGKEKHEMVLGTESQLEELYHTTMRAPESARSGPNAIVLDAGKSGDIVWQFTRLGTVSFACLLPGHYDSGRRGTVTVR